MQKKTVLWGVSAWIEHLVFLAALSAENVKGTGVLCKMFKSCNYRKCETKYAMLDM